MPTLLVLPLTSVLYNTTQRHKLTFAVCDAVRGDGSTHVDHATAIGHFILTGVLAGVVVVD